MEDAERRLLDAVSAHGQIANSLEFAKEAGLDHQVVVGAIKSLDSHEMVSIEGSPEAQVFRALPPEGLPLSQLQESLGKSTTGEAIGKLGFPQAMQLKWVRLDKASGTPTVIPLVSQVEDRLLDELRRIESGEGWKGRGKEALKKDLAPLNRRKLVATEKSVHYSVAKGPKFALEKRRAATDLTTDMLLKGTWREQEFKPYNFDALGLPTTGGHLHPLLKVRTAFRKIFTQMGFEEMPTNAYVESSFWNFDALFQPQQHPARDAHDTFFVTHPETTSLANMPADYVERVRRTHESGDYGNGSLGYGSPWKESEAEKNLLRTHTTAVSSRMLHRLAQTGFRPAKYFSIDRVFRNEAVDRTHLAEFHQIEGVVCDRGLTLGDLIGVLQIFYARLGLEKLRFKPAYNPYTEPSMEIFGYSKELDRWMELGNSGMFRPEMLLPMGLPQDVSVIAFGLGLERPTMILYGIDNIRDLFGHKVSLAMVKKNAICRLGL